jgi:hypothetical protein
MIHYLDDVKGVSKDFDRLFTEVSYGYDGLKRGAPINIGKAN